jgi:hypothetical protein
MIEAVVLYSSNDSRFFKKCIEQLIQCNIKTHVVTYSHMWQGTPENKDILDEAYSLFSSNPLYSIYNVEWNPGESSWYWEGLGRYLATQHVSDSSQYVLYIDADEIIDSERFKKWLDTKEIFNYDSIQLAQYWYWREPIYQSTNLEFTTVLLKTQIAKNLPFTQDGRAHYFNSGNIKGKCSGNDPFIHHYSWVRTKEEMLNKVSNWGHSSERNNWKELVEEEFNRPFNGTDFIHKYNYNIVKNKFNI